MIQTLGEKDAAELNRLVKRAAEELEGLAE